MDWLLAFLPGGSFTAILASIVGGAVVVIGIVWRMVAGAKKAGINQQKVKEAEAREKDIEAIKRAANARPTGGVWDDPNNRDNKKP